MSEADPKVWGEIPPLLHPVRCDACGESWFVRSLGAENRDFWPRHCCYCGMTFAYTTCSDAPEVPLGYDGRPLCQS